MTTLHDRTYPASTFYFFSNLIYDYCNRNEIEAEEVQRCGKYFSLNLIRHGKRKQKIALRDILNFSSPTNLDKYIRMWGGTLNKSIFPYGAYKSVEELRSVTEFPSKDQFFSELKQESVDEEEYQKAKISVNGIRENFYVLLEKYK